MPGRRWWHRLVRSWKREDLLLGARLALAAVAAMVVARLLGLRSFYWAGISAIVVSSGSPGGSFAASLARFGGTLLGLASGLGCVFLLGHSFTAAALAILVAILLCRTFGLQAAMKVSALTTLFPVSLVTDVHGLGPTLSTSFARAENVLLGCAVTIILDRILWPDRISAKLRKLLLRDVGRTAALVADLLAAYQQGQPADGGATLASLQTARMEHLRLLKELGQEPEDAAAPSALLAQQVYGVHELVDGCAALHSILRRVDHDQVQGLLQEELKDLTAGIREAGRTLGSGLPGAPDTLVRLTGSRVRLEAAFSAVRGDRGTQAYPAPEVFRLLGILHLGSSLAEGLARLGTEPELEMAAEA